ncbi:MAG: spondin domain-containing protein, partial [bacterium]
AEDGNPAALLSALDAETGLTNLLAPGVWVIHNAADPLFSADQPDRGEGLEALAEDGDPGMLSGSVVSRAGVLRQGVFNTPAGSSQPGPLLPGHAYSFSFSAAAGEYLSFASMFVQSNDLFYAPDGMGITLFESDGQPVSGDMTSQIMLWDAGTEINEKPGFGLHQAPRQSGPDSGMDENGSVRLVNDGYSYPANSEVLQVTISVQ